jgi:outer membrane immunogenic protein
LCFSGHIFTELPEAATSASCGGPHMVMKWIKREPGRIRGALMKKFFVTCIAAAAFCGAPAFAAPPAAPIFNWSGFYVGAFGGYGWGHSNWHTDYVSPNNFDDSLNPRGAFFGGLIGYNWQAAPNWVLGIEADGAIANLVDSHRGPGDYATLYNATIKDDVGSFGTVRSRAGYTWGMEMFYVTGGWAWLQNKNTLNYPPTTTVNHSSATHSGWAVGAGWEHAFDRNWSVKAEYLYMGFGSKDYLYPTAFCAVPFSSCAFHTSMNIQTVKLGVNYRFGK